jgi:hypothetical protein
MYRRLLPRLILMRRRDVDPRLTADPSRSQPCTPISSNWSREMMMFFNRGMSRTPVSLTVVTLISLMDTTASLLAESNLIHMYHVASSTRTRKKRQPPGIASVIGPRRLPRPSNATREPSPNHTVPCTTRSSTEKAYALPVM